MNDQFNYKEIAEEQCNRRYHTEMWKNERVQVLKERAELLAENERLRAAEFSEVETLQRKIRKLESQLRLYRKANRGKCLPAKGQTGKHATRQALVQSVMAAGMAGRTPQRIAADEGVSTTVIYKILAQYGGAIALRKRKA